MAVNVEDVELNTVKQQGAFNTAKNIAQTGATTFSTGTGQVSLNGNVVLAAGKTMTGGTLSVVSAQGAGPTTLTAAQSGSVILFDRAAGNAYVLPAPTIGLTYTFITTVSVTSNADEVVTDAGTTFLLGSVTLVNNSATPGSGAAFSGDGSTHVEYTNNGSTQGGLLGSQVVFTCVTSTLWNVTGTSMASGTLASPFTT